MKHFDFVYNLYVDVPRETNTGAVMELNPYAKLVRMLEQRYARQKIALSDTELQLQGAKDSLQNWEAAEAKKPKAK